MKPDNLILLSFDVEEFDTPLEYGKELDLNEQFNVSLKGLNAVLKLLTRYDLTATFFTTANFANQFPDLVKSISEHSEIASHGFYHSSFDVKDLLSSRLRLEEIIGKKVHGYRMARMMPVDDDEIRKAGYLYNASLHPTFIPGRYNNLNKPRNYFMKNEVLQIPAAVTPILRFPLFWLSFKNFPQSLIIKASKRVMKKDGYVNLYFHPWEFTDTTNKERFGLPFYVRDNGEKMLGKLENYIRWALGKNYSFCTYYDLFKMVK
jgi:peptidoglycan/xylan/chitin deacetylase (PgdA/CDA1 family)